MKAGLDLVEIIRMERIIARPESMKKCFSEKEITYINEKYNRARTAAGIYAAKEAVLKALGGGLSTMSLLDLWVDHDEKGRPFMAFSDKGRRIVKDLGFSGFSISISHDGGLAGAQAIGLPLDSAGRLKTESPDLLEDLGRKMLKREERGHKGNFGKVALVGGSEGMAGSICLAAQAAMRSGAGLVYALVPKSIAGLVQVKLSEVIIKGIEDDGRGYFSPSSRDRVLHDLEGMDAVGIGPGLSRHEGLTAWLGDIIKDLNAPLVLDADALYAASFNTDILKESRRGITITPHEMEMSRLIKQDIEEIRTNRVQTAKKFATEMGIRVILKGSGTVISDGQKTYINSTGNPGMATAGSGDVLTGILTALAARAYEPMLGARMACFIHGLAGDLAAEDLGMEALIAGDLISYLPNAFKMLQKAGSSCDQGGMFAED